MNIVPSSHFVIELGKLEKGNPQLKKLVIRCLDRLQQNPSYPSLHLHKLSGKGIYSISVNPSIRIILTFHGDEAHLLRMGTHEDVY